MSDKDNRAIRMQEALLRKAGPALSAHQMAIQMLAEKDKAVQSIDKALAFDTNISKILEASTFKSVLLSKIENDITSQNQALINSVLGGGLRVGRANQNFGWGKWQNNPFNKMFGLIGNSRANHVHFNSNTYYFTKIDEAYRAAKFAEAVDLLQQEAEQEETETKESIIISNESIRIISLIEDIHSNNQLMYSMNPRDFEIMIAELLRQKGFDVQLTKQTRDGGYDIMAIQSLGGIANKYLVECKRNAEHRHVDVQVVRSFITTMNEFDANKGVIFTTSYFSPDADKYKLMHPNRLDLKDGVDVVNWISDYKLKDASGRS